MKKLISLYFDPDIYKYSPTDLSDIFSLPTPKLFAKYKKQISVKKANLVRNKEGEIEIEAVAESEEESEEESEGESVETSPEFGGNLGVIMDEENNILYICNPDDDLKETLELADAKYDTTYKCWKIDGDTGAEIIDAYDIPPDQIRSI